MRGKVHRGNPVGFPALSITCHFFFFFSWIVSTPRRAARGGPESPRSGPRRDGRGAGMAPLMARARRCAPGARELPSLGASA